APWNDSGRGPQRDQRGRSYRGRADCISTHRSPDVLDALLAHILEGIVEVVADLVAHRAGNADPAGLSQTPQPRCNVPPIPEDVVVLDDDIAEIDSDPKPDAPIFGHRRF